jgi:glycosyltransferase involved in cell wall biosynthesis
MVSIVLPTYNRADTLEKSIESVLNQTCQDFELIIIDDGSKDNTSDLVSQYMKSHQNIKYFYQDNAGYPAAINRGLIECTGEFIAFEDSDDIWDKEKLHNEIELLKSTNSDFAFCQIKYLNAPILIPDADPADKNDNILPRLLKGNIVGGPTLVFKRECINKIGGFDTKLPSLQDYDFAIRLAQNYYASFVPKPLLYCTLSNDSVSVDNGKYFQAMLIILNKYRNLFNEYPESQKEFINNLLNKAELIGMRNNVETIINNVLFEK